MRIFSSSKAQSAIVVGVFAVLFAALRWVSGPEALAAIVFAATGYMLSTGYEDGRKSARSGRE